MLLLPEPLGPVIILNPGWNWSFIGSPPKDLKFLITILLMCTIPVLPQVFLFHDMVKASCILGLYYHVCDNNMSLSTFFTCFLRILYGIIDGLWCRMATGPSYSNLVRIIEPNKVLKVFPTTSQSAVDASGNP